MKNKDQEIEKIKLENRKLETILNIYKAAHSLIDLLKPKPTPCFPNSGPGLSKWDERVKTMHGCAVKPEYNDPLPIHNNIIILSEFKNSTNGILTIGNLDNWLKENKYKIVKEK